MMRSPVWGFLALVACYFAAVALVAYLVWEPPSAGGCVCRPLPEASP